MTREMTGPVSRAEATLTDVSKDGRLRGRDRLFGFRWTLGMATVLALAGCSAKTDTAAVYPVKGKVALDGTPAAGAFVVFHPKTAAKPVEGAGLPSAQVQADGSFQLTTHTQADGAPAGDYVVTVEWNKMVKQGADLVAGPNVIPPVYSKVDSTPIKVTINQSSNDLVPFEITRKK